MHTKGAAVLDDRHLFLYAKKDPEALRRALPLSYDPRKGTFLTAVFVDGCDYVAQMTEDRVRAALATMCPLEESPLRDRYAHFSAHQLDAPGAINIRKAHRILLAVLVAVVLWIALVA